MAEDPSLADTVPPNVRQWGMACHLIALVGLLGNGIGFLLGPLILWAVKKEDHPFIDEQGKEAVNFQITMFLAAIVSAILCTILIGIVFLLAVGLMSIVFPIIAAVKVNAGERYRYPLSFRFIK